MFYVHTQGKNVRKGAFKQKNIFVSNFDFS